MRPRLLNIAMAGGLLLTALGIASAARSSTGPADGVSCGAIHATSSHGVDTFAVRAVGVSCGLAKKTTSVWTTNDCGAPNVAGGNRVLRKTGNRREHAGLILPGSLSFACKLALPAARRLHARGD